MNKSQEKYLGNLPDSPGVYFFIGKNRKILYIGKAVSLKNRIKSYFSVDMGEKRSPLIKKMVSKVVSVKYQKINSVLEAFILESKLIKKFKPSYNTAGKDQKDFNCVVITEERFPRVLIMREREMKTENLKFKIRKTFGPFPHGKELKEALKIIRKIFPFRDKCALNQKKPCFNYQIGLCSGVCVGVITQKEYTKTINNISALFDGNLKKLSLDLQKEMKILAKNKEFEKANEIKKKIFSLKHIQDVALIKNESIGLENKDIFRIEAYDVAHISGTNMVGAMAVLENGEPNKKQYKMFKIRNQKETNGISLELYGAGDTGALKEILERRFKHPEWKFPNLIVVDGGMAQLNVAWEIFKNSKIQKLKDIKIVSVTKNKEHKPIKIQVINFKSRKLADEYKKEILLANNEAHRFAIRFHRKLRDKNVSKL